MTHEAGIEAAVYQFQAAELDENNGIDDFVSEIIQAYLSASGMVLVPREPTAAMSYAGAKTIIAICEDGMDYNAEIGLYPAEDCFEKMLDAATDPFKS